MPFVAARFIEMLNDKGQISSDTYVYATDDVGRVTLMRADAIDNEWVRYLAEGGVISPFTIPVLTGIAPSTAVVGSPPLTLTATGSDFTEDSKIIFNGGEEPTVFVSDTELTTEVRPETASGDITVPVMVRTGSWESAEFDFTFSAAQTVPTDKPVLNSINPSSARPGDPVVTVNVTGSKFLDGYTVVTFDGVDQPTTFVNSGRVSVQIDPVAEKAIVIGVHNAGLPADATKTFTIST